MIEAILEQNIQKNATTQEQNNTDTSSFPILFSRIHCRLLTRGFSETIREQLSKSVSDFGSSEEEMELSILAGGLSLSFFEFGGCRRYKAAVC